MRSITIFTMLCAMSLIACSITRETHTKTTRRAHNYIYLEEIQKSAASNAYDLIRNLRPHWLRGRGIKSIKFQETSFPVVYVNDSRHGNIQSLTMISAHYIKEIQFLNAGDATFRFGLNHSSGAILITI
ncbi:MAG: hypothetical protein ACE5HX_05315 [bacterium]